jgi:hypothetical protein
MAIAYPGGNNTFVKDLDASGRLITEFSRNPDEFALNSYIQLSNVQKAAGYYLKITPEEAARRSSFGRMGHHARAGTTALSLSNLKATKLSDTTTILRLVGKPASKLTGTSLSRNHASRRSRQ